MLLRGQFTPSVCDLGSIVINAAFHSDGRYQQTIKEIIENANAQCEQALRLPPGVGVNRHTTLLEYVAHWFQHVRLRLIHTLHLRLLLYLQWSQKGPPSTQNGQQLKPNWVVTFTEKIVIL